MKGNIPLPYNNAESSQRKMTAWRQNPADYRKGMKS